MVVNQKAVKVINKIFEAGITEEKDISATVPENGQYILQQETMHPEKKMYRIRIFPDRRSIPYMKLVNGWKWQQESLQQSGLSWRC